MPGSDSLVATVFGWTATFVSCFFFISPIRMFIELTKTKNIEKIPYLMLLFNILNCSFWLIYGMAGGGSLVYICNSIGLCFTLVYIVWYLLYKFETKEMRLISIGSVFAFVWLIYSIGLSCLHKPDNDEFKTFCYNLCFWVAMIVNIAMYAAPGQNLVSYNFLI